MAKRKGLGRGLDALLGAGNAGQTNVNPADVIKAATSAAADVSNVDVSSASDEQNAAEISATGVLKQLPVEFLQPGKYQPRRDMHPEALEELADSIRVQGVMQPIVVRPIGKDKYEIIAGERRWRATQLAELDRIPAVIRDIPDETAIAMALIENIQREDLNPMEEAYALKRLQDEFELTHQQVADTVGKSRAAVSNLIRMLNLSSELKTMVEHGDLEMGHARCLLNLESDQQQEIAAQVVAKGLSVRQTEALARAAQEKAKHGDQPTSSQPEDPHNDMEKLEEKLSEHVGLPVSLQANAKGKGKISFKYSSLDELDGILARLGFES